MLDKSKVVLITGGSEGLGYETAKILAPGNSVIIIAENKSKLQKVAKELGCDFHICDVVDSKKVKETIKKVIDKYGRIDCLINNAGVWCEGELEKNTEAQISKTLEVNVLGLILFTKELIPQMKKQREGLIINISSQAGLYAKAERSVYTASKFAVTGFTESLQLELKKHGIRVTGVYPGKLRTQLFEKVGINKDLSDALEPVEVAKAIEFIVSLPATTVITELDIKSIEN